MASRTRVVGVVAALGAGTLLLWAAVPSGAPALFRAGSTPLTEPSTVADGQSTVKTASAPPVGALTTTVALQELGAKTGPDRPTVTVDPNGVVRTVTAAPGKDLGSDSTAFVGRYAAAFGLTKAHALVKGRTVGVPGGDQVVRYQQTSAGLPILGGEIVVTTTASGKVRSVITDTTSLAPSGGAAKIDAAAARSAAITAAGKEFELDAEGVQAQASLWLYDASRDTGQGKPELRPTWRVGLAVDGHEAATVLLDAINGSVKLVASEHKSGLRRLVCDDANLRLNLNKLTTYACSELSTLGTKATTRGEGAPASSIADVNATYDRLGVAYDYFKNTFGRDSFDGRGAEIRATVRACHLTGGCPYENAFWDGSQFVFGQGWAVDDVAAHEFTHAVTEHASNLYYWYESGAINEALSDIFGQFIDLQTPGDDLGITRWEMGENLPAGQFHDGGAIRDMMDPNRFQAPWYIGDPYWDYGPTDNGGVHTNSGVANFIAAAVADGNAAYGITGIGLTKSEQLWYRTMHLLPSGSNYHELGLTLKSACRELIGDHGITAANCVSVDTALYATNVLFPEGSTDVGCPNEGQPAIDVFFDDMESGDAKWTYPANHYWEFLPSTYISYSYASSGKGSVNGWTSPGSSGHNAFIEMKQSVTVPANGYLGFHYSTILNQGGTGIKLLINNGSGWQQLTQLGGTSGFQQWLQALNPYAGQSVKVGFQVDSPGNSLVDFYLDDFRIFSCSPTIPGPVQDAFAYLEGTDLKIDWMNRNFLGQFPYEHQYDLTFSPAIPGAPTFFRPPAGEPDRYTVTVPGADPNQKYVVTVAIHKDSGVVGPAVTLTADPKVTISCPYSAPVPFSLPWNGRRPIPGAPDGQCFRSPAPRR